MRRRRPLDYLKEFRDSPRELKGFFCDSKLWGFLIDFLDEWQSFSERRSNEWRSERALIIDERDLFLDARARAGAHRKNDERERKLALIFCAHQ